jgi:uncharacterized protein YcbK (DUF882 family)
MHTKEEITVTFRRDGRYVGEALEQLNWILRDWRRDEPTKMDPRLFDIAWEVQREVGSRAPFHVVSAYRSPATNSMLRRRSRGVAKHSQHTQGKAMDFFLPDAAPAEIRAVGMKLQRGGVGYYPSAYTPFIHLDVGSVRSWPRMTRDQLARLFPDGNTVHIPADGQPMEGYETAKATILARGGSVGGYASADFDEGAIMQGSRRSLWASLFGWNEEDESRPGQRRLRTARSAAPPPVVNSDSADMFAVFNTTPAAEPAPAARAARRTPPQTQVAALPPASPEADPAAAPARAAEPVPTPAPPAAPRFVQAPFPLARPSGLGPVATGPVQVAAVQPGATGDRLNWQRGPQGQEAAGPAQAAAAAAEPEARSVMAPAPPRRPDAFALAFAPATGPQPGLAGATLAGTTLAGATTLPLADPPGRLVTVSHPAPPERPRVALAPAAVAAAPAAAASAPPAQLPTARRVDPADRQALDNLFAAVAVGSTPSPSARVTQTRARATQPAAGQLTAEPPPAAALGFTARGPLDTRADRFSGPAVRPLPTTFTSR